MKPIIGILLALSILGCDAENLTPATCDEIGVPVPPNTKGDHLCCIAGESCKHFTCDDSTGLCCENADEGQTGVACM